ncbi:hypothetical protein K0M31_011653 [Melipona bicolor]|uniref:Uncharacterized protein n=1 Tax=Melipona bicolor TaxID=60889 RepID=A0AA40KUY7_9HYME|nr:hypothetical protein K0M31_011653 [Melipona bicolor]
MTSVGDGGNWSPEGASEARSEYEQLSDRQYDSHVTRGYSLVSTAAIRHFHGVINKIPWLSLWVVSLQSNGVSTRNWKPNRDRRE